MAQIDSAWHGMAWTALPAWRTPLHVRRLQGEEGLPCAASGLTKFPHTTPVDKRYI